MSYISEGDKAARKAEAETGDKKAGVYSDEELLALLAGEQRRAIGFENDAELRASRERALLYSKGDLSKDIPALERRSKSVATDLSDTVETVMPDLMEIFTGGEDVVAFIPQNQKDEAAARQETEYLKQVIWQDNPGFLEIYTGLKDALLLKTCVFKYWWQVESNVSEEKFTGKNAAEIELAKQDGEILDLTQEPADEAQTQAPTNPDPLAPQDPAIMLGSIPTYSFTLKKTKDLSSARFRAYPPDDFAVAPDTVRILETTYCVLRSRPRIQDLIAEGCDAEVVRSLPTYVDDDQTVEQARDHAGEHDHANATDDDGDLRQVEIREHYIRLLGEDGKLHIWCVQTDAECTQFIPRDDKSRWEENRIPVAVGTPYLVPHRMYGESLADKLFEVVRVKTILKRALLDSCYFALNQRYEVAQGKGKANQYTISDLKRMEPGVPVRSEDGASVRPLMAAQIPFNAYEALEYFSTDAEQKTGVVRNAQGLNPDTLHDTATGAMALMSAAAKRVRMVARILAETCLKELYLGLHAVIRENGSAETIARLTDGWVPINPSQWAERNNMTVEVGLGASGAAHDLAVATQLQGVMKEIVAGQGGPRGPIVDIQKIYNLTAYISRKLGVKNPDLFFNNPTPPGGQPPAPPPPQPSPEMVRVQGEMQLEQQKHQDNMELKQASAASDERIALAKANAQAAVTQRQNELEHERKMAEQANQLALEQDKIASAERIAVAVARINAEGRIAAAAASKEPADAAAPLAYEEQMEASINGAPGA